MSETHHLVVPLRRSSVGTLAFARDAARLLVLRHPTELTIDQRRDARGRRLHLDIGRNAHAQTIVAPYALRALPGVSVSTPIRWDELAAI